MRIAFFVMIIVLVLMVLVTGVFFVIDLAVQGTCRSIHDDQPYLINVLTGTYLSSHILFKKDLEFS